MSWSFDRFWKDTEACENNTTAASWVACQKNWARWANECTAPPPLAGARGAALLGVGFGGETKAPGGKVGRSRICEGRSPLLLLESCGKCSVHMFRRCHRYFGRDSLPIAIASFFSIERKKNLQHLQHAHPRRCTSLNNTHARAQQNNKKRYISRMTCRHCYCISASHAIVANRVSGDRIFPPPTPQPLHTHFLPPGTARVFLTQLHFRR